jgi:hypothetical protein
MFFINIQKHYMSANLIEPILSTSESTDILGTVRINFDKLINSNVYHYMKFLLNFCIQIFINIYNLKMFQKNLIY